MFACLRHRAVGSRHHQDRAVNLSRAGDHVLDVVGVAGHVHMGIVTGLRLVFHMRHIDGDASLALFGRPVDQVELNELGAFSALRQHLGDSCGQRGLAMVDVAHRAYIHMRLRADKCLLCHNKTSKTSKPPPLGATFGWTDNGCCMRPDKHLEARLLN